MPPTFRIKITVRAENDLDEITDYIATNSPENARTVRARIIGEIEPLEVFPFQAPVYEESADPTEVVRSLSVRPFAVFYRVIEASLIVEILSVRHGARDRPPRFFG